MRNESGVGGFPSDNRDLSSGSSEGMESEEMDLAGARMPGKASRLLLRLSAQAMSQGSSRISIDL